MRADRANKFTQNGDRTTDRSGDRPAAAPIRTVVVDDDELFRHGLVVLLEGHGIRVVAEAAVAMDWIRQAARLMPDVVLIDISLNGIYGASVMQRLTAAAPLTRVLVLADAAEDDEVIALLRGGACGYLLKTTPVGQIIEAVHAASRGECSISPSITSRLVHLLTTTHRTVPPAFAPDLTTREREVLELVARGADNRHIADALYLSQHTVNHYVSHILAKLHVENRIQAAVLAVREGLI